MNFEIYDHLIIGKEGIFSFRNEGLIVPNKKRGEDGKVVENTKEDKKNKTKKKMLAK